MNCIDLGDLHAYIDGALTGDRAAKIEEHLAGCEDCTRALEEAKKLTEFVYTALTVEVPTDVLDSLPTASELRALAEQNAPSVTPISEGYKARRQSRRPMATFLPEWLVFQPQLQAAAVVLLFLGGAYVFIGQQNVPSAVPGSAPSTPQIKSPSVADTSDNAIDDSPIQALEPGEAETTTPSTLTLPPVSQDALAMAKGLPAADDELPIPEIRTGETVLGRLEAGDEVLEDGSFADLWRYRARAGRTVIIDLLSNDFDAYLFIGNEEALILAENDDSSGETTNARISFTPTESTSYGIVVNSYQENSVGQYALSVTLEDPDAEFAGKPPDLSEPDWEALYPENGNPNDSYALIVGISDYPGSDGDLQGPDVDAEQFRGLLVDEFGFQESNIVALTDSEATRDHIVQAFSRHLGQAGPDGAAVFFFSGHGTQLEDNFGLTGIYDPESDGKDEAILVWGSTEYATISDDEIGILADRLEANRTLIVLDACHTGTGTRTTSDGRQAKWTNIEDIRQSLELSAETLVRGATEVSNPRRHVLLAASAAEEKAYTDPDFGYGVFTRMLVEEMRSASAVTTFDDMMTTVRRRTLERTEGIQTPQIEGRLSSSRIREFLSGNR